MFKTRIEGIRHIKKTMIQTICGAFVVLESQLEDLEKELKGEDPTLHPHKLIDAYVDTIKAAKQSLKIIEEVKI